MFSLWHLMEGGRTEHLSRLILRCTPGCARKHKEVATGVEKALAGTWKSLQLVSLRPCSSSCHQKCVLCCLETCLWGVKTSIRSSHIGSLQQTKETMPPKSRLVYQWVYCCQLQEHGWLKGNFIKEELTPARVMTQRNCITGVPYLLEEGSTEGSLFSATVKYIHFFHFMSPVTLFPPSKHFYWEQISVQQ